jgi:flagellar motor switch protein FliM
VTDRTPYRARVHAPGSVLEVQPYDFESPELIGGDARNRLDASFEAWGRQVGLQLTARTRAVVDVAVLPFAVQTFGAFAAGGEGPSIFVVAAIGAGGPKAIWRVPVAEARYWASRMVGGTGADAAGDRPLTAIERALVWRMAEEQLAELHLALDGLMPELQVESLSTEPTGAATDLDELMVTLVLGTHRRGERRQLALAMPSTPVLDALGRRADPQEPAVVADRLSAHVAMAPVEVALRFDPVRVGPSIVLSLTEGDVIPLAHPPHRPLVVALNGAPLLHAAVGSNGDRLAFVVVDSNGGSA